MSRHRERREQDRPAAGRAARSGAGLQRTLDAHEVGGDAQPDQRGHVLGPRAVAALLAAAERSCAASLTPARTQSAPRPAAP